jgi:Kef-type K+ transport system membrane component KefB
MTFAPTPVPPLGPDSVLLFFLQLSVLLLCAVCLGRLARRLGMPAVVGELLTGVVLGPSLLGWAAPGVQAWLLPPRPEQTHLLDAVSQLGAVLLVGIAGAHLNARTVSRRKGAVTGISVGGLAVPLALGIAAGYLFPRQLLTTNADRTTFAIFLGVTMCVSAVPVIAKTLIDMNLMHRDVGQLTLAAATIDSAVGWFLLSLVSAMAVHALGPGQALTAALTLVAFVAAVWFAGRPLVRLALRLAARADEPGPVNATAAIIILLGAAAAQALGLEAAFGALLAGILITTPKRLADRGEEQGAGRPADRVAALRTVVLSVLAPIFLAAAGLHVDLTALGRPPVLAAAAVILLLAMFGKFAGVYLGARLSRLGHWEGIALGVGLNARGVVEVVIAMVGLRLGVLDTTTYTIVVLVAVVTSVMAPPLLRWSMNGVERTAAGRLQETGPAAAGGAVPQPSGATRK